MLLLISCGKKTANSSQAKISFFQGTSSMLGSGAQMNGGIVVIGHKVDDSEKFTMGLVNADDEKVIDLIKGQWEFAAIGWEGGAGGVFTGANRCAYSGIIDLNTNDVAITFNLDFATCANIPGHGAAVSNPAFMNTISSIVNQFKPVTMKSCATMTLPADPTTGSIPGCSGAGLTGSFKFIATGAKKGGMGAGPLPSLQTNCISPLDANGMLVTSFTLPVGNMVNGKKENLMETALQAFQSADCTGAPITYQFNDSMYVGINQTNMKARAYSTAAATDTTLYIEHNATTISSNLGYTPYGYGKDGDWVIPAGLFTQTIEDYGNISAIDSPASTITIQGTSAIGSSGYKINPGDEIMWYVNSEATAGACGGGFVPGMFGFAQVTNKQINAISSNTLLTLDHSITNYQLSAPTPGPTTLAIPTNLGTPCSIQAVRVPNYRNVIVGANPVQIDVTQFVAGSGMGGLYPFRISNELKISGATGLVINATGMGDTGATSSGCPSTSGKRCLKMGSGTANARGGGIVLGWINQINSSLSTSNFTINANGADAPNGGLGSTGGSGGFINTKVGKMIYTGASTVSSIIQNANFGANGISQNPTCSVLDVSTSGGIWSGCDVGASSPSLAGTCWGTIGASTACPTGYRVPINAELLNLTVADVNSIWTATYQAQVNPLNHTSGNTATGQTCTLNTSGYSVYTRSSDISTHIRYATTATNWSAQGPLSTYSSTVRCVISNPVATGLLGVSYFQYCANPNLLGVPTVVGPGGVSQGCSF
jgi:hypothetical protein